MAVESQTSEDQPVEVTDQEIGQVERAGLLVVKLGEALRTAKELVAVRAGEALDSRNL